MLDDTHSNEGITELAKERSMLRSIEQELDRLVEFKEITKEVRHDFYLVALDIAASWALSNYPATASLSLQASHAGVGATAWSDTKWFGVCPVTRSRGPKLNEQLTKIRDNQL